MITNSAYHHTTYVRDKSCPKKTFETFHKAHATRMANAADSGGGGWVGQKFELQDNMPKVLNEIMYIIYYICLESVRMFLKGIPYSFCFFFRSVVPNILTQLQYI